MHRRTVSLADDVDLSRFHNSRRWWRDFWQPENPACAIYAAIFLIRGLWLRGQHSKDLAKGRSWHTQDPGRSAFGLVSDKRFWVHRFLEPAVVLVIGLLVAFGALLLRLQDVAFGEPSGPTGGVKASYVPLFVHMAVVLAAGLWLPEPVVRWFRAVAAQLGGG